MNIKTAIKTNGPENPQTVHKNVQNISFPLWDVDPI